MCAALESTCTLRVVMVCRTVVRVENESGGYRLFWAVLIVQIVILISDSCGIDCRRLLWS